MKTPKEPTPAEQAVTDLVRRYRSAAAVDAGGRETLRIYRELGAAVRALRGHLLGAK